jgi:hypothetical protein
MIGLYVQDVLGYSALHVGIGFIPLALALGFGNVLTARLVTIVAAVHSAQRSPPPSTPERPSRRANYLHTRQGDDDDGAVGGGDPTQPSRGCRRKEGGKRRGSPVRRRRLRRPL